MYTRFSVRLYVAVWLAAALLATAAPAHAQFVPRSVGSPVFGEDYKIEGSFGLWSPTANMSISSESLGIEGDDIDFKKDLGLEDHTFPSLVAVFHPARKHKLRYEYLPLKYEQSATVTREITFNGQKYVVGVPIDSAIDWRTHRFGYEYDFVATSKVLGGFILEAKYTDIRASLESKQVKRESVHGAAPVPELGGAVRVYVMPNLAVGGEITGVGLPHSIIEGASGHYFDYNFYGTYNFTNNIGAQAGYRRLDLGYIVDDDRGSFLIRGFYFGAVVRY